MSTYENRRTHWTAEEDKHVLKLRKEGCSYKYIGIIHNQKFKTIRTTKAIETRFLNLTRGSYNIEIDKIIISYVRKYPANLQYAFEKCAKHLNIKYKVKLGVDYNIKRVGGRYYSYIRKNYNVIAVGSEDGFTINIKNAQKRAFKNQPKLTPVLLLLKEILNLPDHKRKQLILLLKD